MKYILVIGDGMADEPLSEYGGKTPLQYASTPTMDKLASAGKLGTVRTVSEGMPAGSDVAILSIFGCDPKQYLAGRAALEAAASGITVLPGDIAYRCNMVTLEDADVPFEKKKILSHSGGSIEGDLADALLGDLFALPEFAAAAQAAGMTVFPGNSFRHIAVQAQGDIDGIHFFPPHDHLGTVIESILPDGGDNANVLKHLMKLAHELLDKHPINDALRAEGKLPANGIWFWAQGTSKVLPNFTEKYGKTGAIVSEVPLCQGIGVLLGLDIIMVDGATGELHTNYEGMTEAALSALEDHDFSTIHIEAPDECTHNGDTAGKIQAIEWIDSRVLAPMLEQLDKTGKDFRMLVISDHKTLTSTRGHDGTPVPYIIYDSRIDHQTGLRFCEADAECGSHIDTGTSLMDVLFETKDF
ncbi:MAG: 2,3-bisphosphoglycerate-independent phosphoglycerate mutase [Oscillospiraceae bacterium]|nr:2,3-bisphosphoglycerate-independent phosphoglycerate mutase [Oscillospiraceae bacterium]